MRKIEIDGQIFNLQIVNTFEKLLKYYIFVD